MSLPEKNSFNALGGELVDYSPVTDPTTDLSAEASNEARADTAAMTRTAVRAWLYFRVSAGAIVADSVVYDSVFGNSNAYKPVITYNSTGDYTVTFPTTVVDSRGATKSLNFQAAFTNYYRFSAGIISSAFVSSANTVEVALFDTGSPGVTDPTDPTDKIFVFII